MLALNISANLRYETFVCFIHITSTILHMQRDNISSGDWVVLAIYYRITLLIKLETIFVFSFHMQKILHIMAFKAFTSLTQASKTHSNFMLFHVALSLIEAECICKITQN